MQTLDLSKRRRQSIGSDTSPLQRASMVGSFEESILHGWMSTPPSRPLDFTAKIGALGKGHCKPKFPPHIIIPFPAVFYSWGREVLRGGDAESEPSPYVGTIDLQNQQPVRDHGDVPESGPTRRPSDDVPARKRKRRSTGPGALDPPPGHYRIPAQGQLQIVIQNPNKTAVKLFIVPYDLSAMEPGTKTFIRQRSSLTGGNRPLCENEDGPMSPRKKQRLRYMIHINICCTAIGKFYLYHQIRAVFANRVPDDPEQLQCETLVPSPRFTPYHPPRRSAPTSAIGTPLSRPTVPASLGSTPTFPAISPAESGVPLRTGTPPPPVPAIPVCLAASRPDQGGSSQPGVFLAASDEVESRYPGQRPSVERECPATAVPTRPPIPHAFEVPWRPRGLQWRPRGLQFPSRNGAPGTAGTMFDKYRPDDRPYGSPYGRACTPRPGEGILAKQLQEIDIAGGMEVDRTDERAHRDGAGDDSPYP